MVDYMGKVEELEFRGWERWKIQKDGIKIIFELQSNNQVI